MRLILHFRGVNEFLERTRILHHGHTIPKRALNFGPGMAPFDPRSRSRPFLSVPLLTFSWQQLLDTLRALRAVPWTRVFIDPYKPPHRLQEDGVLDLGISVNRFPDGTLVSRLGLKELGRSVPESGDLWPVTLWTRDRLRLKWYDEC